MRKILSKFQGVMVACLTPLTDSNDVDPGATKRLVRFLMDSGIHGLFILGTTGEGMLLSVDQRKRFAECVVRYVGTKIPIVVHTSHLEIEKVKDLVAHAQQIGACAVAVLPPFSYNISSEKAVEKYFSGIMKTFPDCPFFVYNMPELTKSKVTPSMIRRLRQCNANLVGLKDSAADFISLQEVLLEESGLAIFVGSDNLSLFGLTLGAAGLVSGPANVLPELYIQLYKAVLDKNFDEAKRNQAVINQIGLLLRDNIALFKKAMTLRGICVGNVKEPLSSVNAPRDSSTITLIEKIILRYGGRPTLSREQ